MIKQQSALELEAVRELSNSKEAENDRSYAVHPQGESQQQGTKIRRRRCGTRHVGEGNSYPKYQRGGPPPHYPADPHEQGFFSGLTRELRGVCVARAWMSAPPFARVAADHRQES